MADWKFLGDQTEEEFLGTARDNMHNGLQADSVDRADAEDDSRFYLGGDYQWDEQSLQMRRPADKTKPRKPVMSWNRLHGPVYQVVNDGRMNKTAIRITPEDGGDQNTAEYLQSRIRHIEYESDADIAYDTGRQNAAICGRAFIRIRTDFESPRSFLQKAIIDEIKNPFTVVWDPAAIEYDLKDANWFFIIGKLSEDVYKRKYGKDAFEKWSAFWNGPINHVSDWCKADGMVPEVEYWVNYFRKDTLWELSDGREALQSEMTKDQIAAFRSAKLRNRETYVPQVVQYLIDGASILDEIPWIGERIPIIPHWGDSVVVEGKDRRQGVIRQAKDPQRLLNLTVSNIAEITANIPKPRWAVAEGQVTGYEDTWLPNFPGIFRIYRRWDSQNRDMQAPILEQTEPPIQALSIQLGQSIDAVKSGTNVFNAALGDRSNETSGRAINARKVESDIANFHIQDNEARTRKAIGRVLIDIVPKLDAQRKQTTVRDVNGNTRIVKMEPTEKGIPYTNARGEQVFIKPTEGQYGVAASQGPTYTSQRQEAAETYGDIAKNYPPFMELAGDLYFRNLDAPGADDIADRFEQKIIPPEFRKAKEGEPVIPPEAKQLLMKHKQVVDALNARCEELEGMLGQLQNDLKSRLSEKQMEVESREKVALMQEETKRTIALAQLESNEAVELLKQEIAAIKSELENARAEKAAAMQQEEAERDRQYQVEQQAMAAPEPEAKAEETTE